LQSTLIVLIDNWIPAVERSPGVAISVQHVRKMPFNFLFKFDTKKIGENLASIWEFPFPPVVRNSPVMRVIL
jgi:hypothetical protein